MTPSERADLARTQLADLIDAQLRPLGLAAIDALDPKPGESILDIGCGAGETLLQLADRVGPTGRIVGVDIAPHVTALARQRTVNRANISVIQHDAATLSLPDATFDRLYSRFGVMAFNDRIAAFRNLRRLLSPRGRVSIVCWRAMKENELDQLPIHVTGLAGRVDLTPFSFERRDDIHETLRVSGFKNIAIDPLDMPVTCGGIDDTLKVLTTVGALGKILRDNPDLAPAAMSKLREALIARETDGQIHLGAAVWIVTASA